MKFIYTALSSCQPPKSCTSPQEERLPELQQSVSAEQRWLRLRSLSRGVPSLLLHSRLLTFLDFPLSPSLFGSRHFRKSNLRLLVWVSVTVLGAGRVEQHINSGCWRQGVTKDSQFVKVAIHFLDKVKKKCKISRLTETADRRAVSADTLRLSQQQWEHKKGKSACSKRVLG
jgi:hypothetical protein